MYINGKLVWGTEPDGTTAVPGADIEGGTVTPPTSTAPPTTKPPVTTTTQTAPPVEPTTKNEDPTGGSANLYGDANCDKKVSIADAAAILQYMANSDKYTLSAQGKLNADVNGKAGITPDDAIVIMKIDAGMIKQTDLPLEA
jgi:hypothetical protein